MTKNKVNDNLINDNRSTIFELSNSRKKGGIIINIIDVFVDIKNCTLGDWNWLRTQTALRNTIIQNDVFVGFRCNIQNTFIGNRVQIASLTKIGKIGKKPVTIHNDVWIGTEAIIEPGVVINSGAVIGARTHITQDVDSFCIVRPPGETSYNRNVYFDGQVNFRTMIKNKKESKYFKNNKQNNFVTADLEGSFQKIGKGNILIGSSLTNGGIFLEDKVRISNNCIFEGAGGIRIGENTVFGNQVHIISNSHDHRFFSLPMTKSPVNIGTNVQIGSNVLIMPGISISNNTNIADGSIILKNI